MPLRFRLILVLVFPLFAGGFLQAKELVIVAHRGANHLAPENTIAATQKCVDLGVDYVEIDIRTSKDGVMYILHDKTLDRTTNGSGEIKERGSEYIDRLDAGSWFGSEFADQRVPRLKPYLRQFKGKVKIYFDVKAADLAELVALVHEAGFAQDCFFWFSNDERARELRALDRHIPLKMNAVDVAGLRRVMDYNPQIIEYRLEHLTPEFIAFCREHDLKLMAHALGEGFEMNYQAIIDSAADMVNLDRADEMIGLLN
ncbi:MAG: glycerophosphodiester phosphodiesterase family protein [Opitutaceae bacterium]|nr:glycerophosphodiester phosphodiesterase family protein [Opitutaceae bacterium]